MILAASFGRSLFLRILIACYHRARGVPAAVFVIESDGECDLLKNLAVSVSGVVGSVLRFAGVTNLWSGAVLFFLPR